MENKYFLFHALKIKYGREYNQVVKLNKRNCKTNLDAGLTGYNDLRNNKKLQKYNC